uniref:Uncharacterized protein n=1 Tax=Monopterus albus TaxID=43700 RepID=A0A3Q3ITN4_MONAL
MAGRRLAKCLFDRNNDDCCSFHLCNKSRLFKTSALSLFFLLLVFCGWLCYLGEIDLLLILLLSSSSSSLCQSSAVDLKTKEEKDAELDKRIEALRKKNEALVKRYQEIEEDKKKAEQEGIAVTTPRKPRPHEPETDRRKMEKENLTVTVDLSKPTGEKRVVNDWKPGIPRGRKTSEESDGHKRQSDGHSPARRTGSGRMGWGGQRGGGGGGRQERREWEPRTPRDGEPGESGGQGRRGRRRGRGGEGGGVGTPGGMDRKSKEWEEKRRQNIEKMNEEMERIAEYERGQRPDGDKPIRNFLDDPRRSGPAPDIDRKEGSRRHVRNWGGLDFDNVKTGAELEKEWTVSNVLLKRLSYVSPVPAASLILALTVSLMRILLLSP